MVDHVGPAMRALPAAQFPHSTTCQPIEPKSTVLERAIETWVAEENENVALATPMMWSLK